MIDASDHDRPIRPSSNRSFGIVFGVAFAIVALAPLLGSSAGAIRIWALAFSAGFFLVGFLLPNMLRPLATAWARLGIALHHVTQPILLGLIYFTAVAPTGFCMRMFGKDNLRLRRQSRGSSYWIERSPPGPSPETMSNQF